jgi:hypothetical protein
MTPLARLCSAGLSVRCENGRLIVTPASKITPSIRDFIRREKSAIVAEFALPEPPPRRSTSATKNVPALIDRWYRQLALQHHPDRGGDVKVMQAMNEAYRSLKQLVQEEGLR